jgi:ATP-binding cassette subfamily G (WHITE) protein 2 (SNQ2)
MPVLFVQLAILDVIVYFMSGLQAKAGKFFNFLFLSFVLTGSITVFFRAVGYAVGIYHDATKITGRVFTAFVVVSDPSVYEGENAEKQYSGFVLYQPARHLWLSCIRWINPVNYSIEAVLLNEYEKIAFQCGKS